MFKYGMRLRGFAPMCQPMKALDHAEDDPTGKYYNILFYKEKLQESDVTAYELDYMGEEK